ncbi:MAG: hypothetical protein SFU85_00465 [Candidatus Methylacidiphilales bacterium]|nr:hypothetical protein [Candidatus Methylacidiphilales bacterium]
MPRFLCFQLLGYGLICLLVEGRASGDKQDGFDSRRTACLEAVAAEVSAMAPGARPGWGDCFPMASALFALGRDTEACRLAGFGLDALEPGNTFNRWHHNGNSGFAAWPGIDCYLRWQGRMDPALKERFRKVYGGAVFYRRMSTSNHKIMAAVTRTLATQAWGEGVFHPDPFYPDPDGSRFAKDDPTGVNYLHRIIESTAGDAPGEYASRPYGMQNLLPLLSLADLAADREMAHRARLAYERSLMQLAPCWLSGHLATFSLRSYPDILSQQPWGLGLLLWLNYGGVAPEKAGRGYHLLAAVSDYRPPEMAVRAATDRTRPYVHRAFISQWAMTHFINRTYALFSRSPKGGKPWFNGQVYPCGVMWEDADSDRTSFLWVTHPVADADGDADHVPGGIHTHGASRYERQVQREGSVLSVYDIPEKDRFPHLLVFVPGGYRAVLREEARGRLFLHYGTVLVAMQSSAPFVWNPLAGVAEPAGKPAAGDSEFRIPERQAAVALETALPEEFPAADPPGQLAAFRQALDTSSKLVFRTAPVAAEYTDRGGHRLACDHAGSDRIDGVEVDYANWPLLENPWMRQGRAGPLVLGNRTESLTYDFSRWTVEHNR